VEHRDKQLTDGEEVACNNILSAEINRKNSVNQFNQWPENDGMHS
jgi:hypothetical protein